MSRCALVTALLLLAAAGASAQPVMPGDQARIRSSTVSGQFTVTGRTADGITVVDGTGAPVDVAFASMRELSLRRGQRTPGQGLLRGAAIGGAAGAIAGLALGFAAGDDPPGTFIAFSAEEKALAGGLVLGGAGVLVGGIAGLVAPGDRWERVSLANAVTVGPSAGGLGVQYTHRF